MSVGIVVLCIRNSIFIEDSYNYPIDIIKKQKNVLPLIVHLGIVLIESAGGYLFQPFSVGQVPVNGKP